MVVKNMKFIFRINSGYHEYKSLSWAFNNTYSDTYSSINWSSNIRKTYHISMCWQGKSNASTAWQNFWFRSKI